MKIKIAGKAGFCYGVRKAVELAEKAAGENKKPIYTAGPLIHNQQEVRRLSGLGVKVLSSVENIGSGTIVIRTHGLPKKTMLKLRRKALTVIDATCPFVKRVQHLVEKLSKDGYNIIVIGEKNHPEVVGLVSYSSKPVVVVNTEEGVKRLALPPGASVAIVSQTTQSSEKFNKLVSLIRKKYRTAKIYNTICNASNERQKAAASLAGKVDVMLVIGGKNSGNTARLNDICRKRVKTYHIESARDIKESWVEKNMTIGITAGASTPEWIINEVVAYLSRNALSAK